MANVAVLGCCKLQVRMKDVHTDEQLTFKCRRWMSRDEDDHEICRELPAVRDGEPSLPSKYIRLCFYFVYMHIIIFRSTYLVRYLPCICAKKLLVLAFVN